MSSATFTLSAFGDEIATDLEEQLQLLNQLGIYYLDVRKAWGKNVLHLEDEEISHVRQVCADYGVGVACIGSPVGKSPITQPIEQELANLTRLCQIGEGLGCRYIRVFSFYPPDADPDRYVEEAVGRLARLAELAEREGFILLLENEKGIMGDTLVRCHALMSGVNSPYLRFLWDPANFVQVGEAEVTQRGWPLFADYVEYVHIKDAHLEDGSVCAAGEGDGGIKELLFHLWERGYQGFLSLEPHLKHAGHSSGHSGVEGMTYAVQALRALMAQAGCMEKSYVKRDWWPNEFRKMVALGESTTAGGWSSSPERCWVAVLADMISDYQSNPVECVNSGIGANVISTRSPSYAYSGKPAASERLDRHVIAHQPDLVLVSYGLNDSRGRTPLELFRQELTSVVRHIKQGTKALVVLLGPYYAIDFRRGGERWGQGSLDLLYEYNAAISEIAQAEECLFVDILAANGETDWMVHYDGVHANDLGHRIIANEVFTALARNCSGLARHTKALERVSPRWRDESVLKADYGY